MTYFLKRNDGSYVTYDSVLAIVEFQGFLIFRTGPDLSHMTEYEENLDSIKELRLKTWYDNEM